VKSQSGTAIRNVRFGSRVAGRRQAWSQLGELEGRIGDWRVQQQALFGGLKAKRGRQGEESTPRQKMD
jgi:hypothetical protein